MKALAPKLRIVVRGALIVFPALAMSAAQLGETAREPARRYFFKDSRAELAFARVRGDSTVSLVIAAARGRSDDAAAVIARLGGVVRYRAEEVDYLRARIPTVNAERIFESDAIQTADMDVVGAWTRPILQADETTDVAHGRGHVAQDTVRRRWPPALDDYPITNPYSPLADIDADVFRRDNPTFDGRGVTIAVLDGIPDMLRPELRTALTQDGQPTRKLVDIIDVADPGELGEPANHWIAMKREVSARGGRFMVDDKEFRAADGQYRFNYFDESKFTGTINKDLNRDGNGIRARSEWSCARVRAGRAVPVGS